MLAQASTKSEDDDGVDGQNVAHMLLDHKVLNSKPAHAKKRRKKKTVSRTVQGEKKVVKRIWVSV